MSSIHIGMAAECQPKLRPYYWYFVTVTDEDNHNLLCLCICSTMYAPLVFYSNL
jgi:hypothetical protein